MNDADIRFEREKLDAVVPVGTYLIDAARRVGVRLENECDPAKRLHNCEVSVIQGAANLSAVTKAELEHFASTGRRDNERLACEARIEKPGEIVIMTKEKAQEPKQEEKKDPLQDEFANLPLEKKIASLLRMEAVTLGETLSFVVNSPLKVLEKAGDVIAEFGVKLENEARKAARPEEHTAEPAPASNTGTPPRTKPGRKSGPKKP